MTSASIGLGRDFSPETLIARWEEFFRSSGYDIKAVVANDEGRHAVQLAFGDLDRCDSDIAQFLLAHPLSVLTAGEEAFRRLLPTGDDPVNIRLRIVGLPDDAVIDMNRLQVSQLGHLVRVDGLVQHVSDRRQRLVKAAFQCLRSGDVIVEEQGGEKLREPLECYEEQGGCKRTAAQTKFRFLPEASTFVDSQTVRIRDGSVPDSKLLQVRLEEDLMGISRNAQTVRVVGVLSSVQEAKDSRTFDYFVDANSIEVLDASTRPQRESVADVLIDVAEEGAEEFFLDQQGMAYASVRDGRGGVLPMLIDSHELKVRLQGEYVKRTGRSAYDSAFRQAVLALQARAQEGRRVRLGMRFVLDGDTVVYDLANEENEVVTITRDGWVVGPQRTPLFRRTASMLPQVRPQGPGDVKLIHQHIPAVKDEEVLLEGDTTGTFFDVPRPMLTRTAGKGTGKSLRHEMYQDLTDPSAVPSHRMPKDLKDFRSILGHHAVVTLGNISYLSEAQSNELCTAIDGSGSSVRELYTTDEEHTTSYRCKLLIDGIKEVVTKPDAMDRSLRLETVRPARYVEREQLWEAFRKDKPAILAGIFDTIAGVLRIRDEVRVELRGKLPRLADYAVLGESAARILGHKKLEFLDAYLKNRADANRSVLEGSLVARLLMEFVTGLSFQAVPQLPLYEGKRYREQSWKGTVKQLLLVCQEQAEKAGVDWREAANAEHPTFPRSSKGMANEVRGIESNLVDEGIVVEWGDHTKEGRVLTLTRSVTMDTNGIVTVVMNRFAGTDGIVTQTQLGGVGDDETRTRDDRDVTPATAATSPSSPDPEKVTLDDGDRRIVSLPKMGGPPGVPEDSSALNKGTDSSSHRHSDDFDQTEEASELRGIILALQGPDADTPYEDVVRIATERGIRSPTTDRWLERWTEDGTITTTRPGYIRWNARSGP